MRLLKTLIIAAIVLTSCKKDDAIAYSELLLTAKRYDNPGIYDQQGRYMLLRGVNLNTIGDYWVANEDIPPLAPYEPNHFDLMASYGFNCVRLLIHWSKLEPDRGGYNYAYIEEIKSVIEDAAARGIYVLLDMHQDAWSKFVVSSAEEACEYPINGWDGAPEWATKLDASTCTDQGRRESAPIVYESFRNFWLNIDGIQDAFISTWQEVVKATAHYPTVLGYDVFNEPTLGNGNYFVQGNKYSQFLSKAVKAIRSAEQQVGGFEHIFFFETTITWGGEEIPYSSGPRFTNDDNVVFAPHNYFEVIIQDILTLEQGAALFQGLADNTYGTHCFIGEWGVFGEPESELPKLKRFAAAEDKHFMGSTWWQWCQAPGDPHAINWAGDSYAETSLHLVEVDASGNYTGIVNDLYLNVLGRSRPIAIHGQPISFKSNPDDGTMTLKANSGEQEGETILWVPDRFGVPIISGNNVTLKQLTEVDGGYKIAVAVIGKYEVSVSF